MTDPLDLVEEALLAHTQKVKRSGDKITACCPAHEDRKPSLSVKRGDQRDIVVHCHTGCSPDDVMAAIGLDWTDLGEPVEHRPNVTIVSASGADEYPYLTADGEVAYVVTRSADKEFRQKRPDGQGGWINNLDGVERLPYHLPQVLKAVAAGETIWIAEGEKDVKALEWAGAAAATCNSGGVGGNGVWPDLARKWLAGATVKIVADDDEPGRKHAEIVRQACIAAGCTVAAVVQAAIGKDAADHIAAGLTLDDFIPWEEVVDWPDPVPLSSRTDHPPFPVGELPRWMQPHVLSVAAEQQVAADLPAILGLTALALSNTKRYRVHVQGSWFEPMNLYTVVALPPSTGKSPVFKRMFRAIADYELELADWAEAQAQRVAQDRRMIEKAMKMAEEKGLRDEARNALEELRDTPEVVIPRLIADDITVEALVDLLREQGGRLGLLSPEGGPFDAMAGRYSDRANLDPYLMAWSGDTIRVNRIGRGSTIVRDPLLTIGLTVQPSVIESLAAKPELVGRGLTARFMYSVPEDYVGRRDFTVARHGDEMAAAEYDRHLAAMIRRELPDEPETIELDAAAWQRFAEWRQALEARRTPNGDLRTMASWTSKLESSVARLAGLLLVADGERGAVDDETMRRAISIGNYWLAHGQIVHDMWGTDPNVAKARMILSWVAETGRCEFTMRDVQMNRRTTFPNAADAVEPLRLLVDFGWIRQTNDAPLVAGRRGKASPAFEAHPFVHNLTEQSAQCACGELPPHVAHVADVPKKTKKTSIYLSTYENGGGDPSHEPQEPQENDPPRRRITAKDIGL